MTNEAAERGGGECQSEVWYRWDGHSDYFNLGKFPVLRHTAKGVWINVYGKPVFCLNYARKRFAYPTKELAAESFIIRKQRQIDHLETRLEVAREDLRVFSLPKHKDNRSIFSWEKEHVG